MRNALWLALTLLLTLSLQASEGKWTPQQVLEIDPQWLKAQGLELPPERLWDAQRGTGLLAATINIGGCSAGWISADGLFITNHHCLFGLLQEHATPENDIITNGFLARTREAELRGTGARVTIPRRFTDVSSRILAAIPKKANDLQRYRAIESATNAIVAECEKQPGMRCSVAAHDGGVQYVLQEMAEIGDVRLVYAPPRAVGEYGGEVDNWMWPRHTGDFAIGRAYVDGKPYKPEFFFPISTKGVRPGDFVMVLGYPGVTYRSLTSDEMEERHQFFAARRSLYAEWISLLESSSASDAAGRIAVADTVKSLANRQKNAEGQIAGFARGRILERQREADRAVLQSLGGPAKQNAAAPAALASHAELAQLANQRKQYFDHDFLLEHLRMSSAASLPIGPAPLVLPTNIARRANQLAKKESERETMYMARNASRLKQAYERAARDLFAPADRALTISFVKHALALPKERRIAAIDAAFAGVEGEAAIGKRVDELFAASKVMDAAERTKMLEESVAQLRARRDPLLEIGFALAAEVDEMVERKDQWAGAVSRLRPEWRRAVIAHAGKPVAPDANSTLRVSFAHVKGYAPRDAVWYQPQTKLSGVVEKHTGEEPFDVPANILAAAAQKKFGRWFDETLGDVPVCFLSDADTTGGNSGSPTVNGRGELVGVNFDRVWENVANDFGYMPEVGRNVNADVRYMLWLLEQVDGATELLEELGVK